MLFSESVLDDCHLRDEDVEFATLHKVMADVPYC